mmetsp:Transcript_13248/g.23130  ORF Transcript_13248/g.23130 Transcript_13248/m.23130 type:complete len:549 (+) Transcript_13248:30-1676(+)
MLKESNNHEQHHDTLSRQTDVVTMEGTQPQENDPDDEISEELNNLTITEKEPEPKSPEEEKKQDHLAVTTNQSEHHPAIDRSMKLIVRSQYWGRALKGKTCRTAESLNRPYRTISGQAVLYNTDEFWGCCPQAGRRVLELQECHFNDATPDIDWDLYMVGSWVGVTHAIHDFFLLPQSQTVIDINRNSVLHGWTYVGTCSSGTVRSDLDGMLRGLLQENDTYGYRYHHVHVEIMMDKAFDRETPRSRKMNNEKARQERQHTSKSQESSEHTDDTTSSAEREGPPSIGKNNPFVVRPNAAPPIPHVISNDSSSVFSHSVASSGLAFHKWMGTADNCLYWPSAPPAFHATPSGVPTLHGQLHPGMQWHPGSALPFRGSHLQQMSWSQIPGMPPTGHPQPPPPPIHGHLPSPTMHHHQPMSELQHYLMYSDPHATGQIHQQQSHNSIPSQHHMHHAPFSPHATAPPPYAIESSNNNLHLGNIPHEILSAPAPNGSGPETTMGGGNVTVTSTVGIPSGSPQNAKETVVTTVTNGWVQETDEKNNNNGHIDAH